MVRNMNPAVQNPTDAYDNLTVYLKGAPERVINRCSTLLMDVDERGRETEIPLGRVEMRKIDLANEKFGGSGERVLAFAKRRLNPSEFNKNY